MSIRGPGFLGPARGPDEESPEGAGPAGAATRPFEARGVSGVHLAAAANRRTGFIVVRDRHGADDFLARILTSRPGRARGVMEDLVEALGGPEAARSLGVRRMRTLGSFFGGAAEYRVPVEVSARLTRGEYDPIDEHADMVLPFTKEIARALAARNRTGGSSTGGLGIHLHGAEPFLSVRKYNVVNAHGLF